MLCLCMKFSYKKMAQFVPNALVLAREHRRMEQAFFQVGKFGNGDISDIPEGSHGSEEDSSAVPDVRAISTNDAFVVSKDPGEQFDYDGFIAAIVKQNKEEQTRLNGTHSVPVPTVYLIQHKKIYSRGYFRNFRSTLQLSRKIRNGCKTIGNICSNKSWST